MRALLKDYRQSPRKVRLVADLIRQKDVATARTLLNTTSKRAAPPIKKLLESAVANARHNHKKTNEGSLYIKEIRVDEGPTLKRRRARARGSAYLIRKRTSRIFLVLGEQTEKENRTSSVKKTMKKSTVKKQVPQSSENSKPTRSTPQVKLTT